MWDIHTNTNHPTMFKSLAFIALVSSQTIPSNVLRNSPCLFLLSSLPFTLRLIVVLMVDDPGVHVLVVMVTEINGGQISAPMKHWLNNLCFKHKNWSIIFNPMDHLLDSLKIEHRQLHTFKIRTIQIFSHRTALTMSLVYEVRKMLIGLRQMLSDNITEVLPMRWNKSFEMSSVSNRTAPKIPIKQN